MTVGNPGEELRVATDGSCNPNPGPGGWAWIAEETRPGVAALYGAGSFAHGTNNIGELLAIREVLTAFPDRPLIIEYDSKYAMECVTVFGVKWRRKSRDPEFHERDGRKNVPLIFSIIEIIEQRQFPITWTKVKAHSLSNAHPLNTAVDKLAGMMSKRRADTRELGAAMIDWRER